MPVAVSRFEGRTGARKLRIMLKTCYRSELLRSLNGLNCECLDVGTAAIEKYCIGPTELVARSNFSGSQILSLPRNRLRIVGRFCGG